MAPDSKPHSELMAEATPLEIRTPDAVKIMTLHPDGRVEFMDGQQGQAATLFVADVYRLWRSALPEPELRLADALRSTQEQHATDEHAWKCLDEERVAEITRLKEQLEAYRRALEEIAKTEWFDGEDRFAGPDDIARMALAVSEVRHVGDGPEHLRYIEGWELNPASSPTYHVPEEHGRFPAVGMTAPDPATQRGHTEYRSNLLGETTAGASSPASEPKEGA